MKISLHNLTFCYDGKAPVFCKLNAEFDNRKGRPLVILGPSGAGKTTLLRLMGGLLKPKDGDIRFSPESNSVESNSGEHGSGGHGSGTPRAAFMFQEPRLLPWLTVLENVRIPLEKELGSEEAGFRAGYFLSLVSLKEKEKAYPKELSGGEAQRVSMARAFAWPAQALLMDEPFQSLDIPLRLSLMDLTLSLLEKENPQDKRLLAAVTHDPREAVYMAGRIIVLGKGGGGIIFDRVVDLSAEDRAYGSAAAWELEKEIIEVLKNSMCRL